MIITTSPPSRTPIVTIPSIINILPLCSWLGIQTLWNPLARGRVYFLEGGMHHFPFVFDDLFTNIVHPFETYDSSVVVFATKCVN